MSDVPIRVTLKLIHITDNLELGDTKQGEFVFTARVESDAGGVTETRVPAEGVWFISQLPGKNRVRCNQVLFEGPVNERLVVKLSGMEQDRVTASDSLEAYERVFTGPPSSWVGSYTPADGEGDGDPENMTNWKVGYEIAAP